MIRSKDSARKKILLISPQTLNYTLGVMPAGLAYIAAYLRAHGHTVTITSNLNEPTHKGFFQTKKVFSYNFHICTDHQVDEKVVQSILDHHRPDLIGISMATQVFPGASELAATIRRIAPGVPIIAGGAHPTLAPEEVMDSGMFDIAVIGEGEETFLELADSLPDRRRLAEVKGIAYRDAKGETILTESRPPIADLDKLPFPDLSCETYEGKRFRISKGQLYASRGCPYNCTYCATPHKGKQVRFRSAKNVVDEIEHTIRTTGVTNTCFWDDVFGINRKLTHEICLGIIKRKFRITWDVQTFPGLLDLDTLRLMKKAGCIMVSIGIQSADKGILKSIKRPTDLDKVEASCALVKKAGLELRIEFIIGFPDETEQSIDSIKRLIRRIGPNIMRVNILTPLPGSELYEDLKRDGKLLCDDISQFMFENPATFTRKHLTNERLIEARKEINDVFVRIRRQQAWDPKYLLREFAVGMRNPDLLLYKIRDFLVLHFRPVRRSAT